MIFRSLVAFAALVAAPIVSAQVEFPKAGGVGLDPPDGMVLSSRFAGFEDAASGASILVAELPAEAFAQLDQGFTPDALLTKGIVAGEREARVVEGAHAAFLVRGTQSMQGVDYDKWMLVIGSRATTAMVTVQVPQEVDAYPDEAIDAALASVALRAPSGLEEQIAALPFALGDHGGFRAVSVLAGSTLLLTEGPHDTFEDGEQPSLVIGAGLGDSLPPSDAAREAFARRALATTPGLKGIDVGIAKPVAGGVDLAATATSSDNGAALFVLQSVRFFEDRYVRLIGLCRAAERGEFEARFERVARSLAPPPAG